MTDPWRRTVVSMAMPFRVVIDTADHASAESAAHAFHGELEWADSVFSLWREDSAVSQFNRGEIAVDEGPPELLEVLQACEWYRGFTEGAFDARGAVGIDPTGLVKGWAVARAVAALDALAAPWMVDASGDVLVSGPRADGSPWRVGIADPRVQGDPNGRDVVDVVELGADFLALATSGAAQRGAHIWDPETGEAATCRWWRAGSWTPMSGRRPSQREALPRLSWLRALGLRRWW
jgi:thiamine biosynthesis lipoprotein